MRWSSDTGRHITGFAALAAALLFCSFAFGHGQHELPRHVAPEGRDTGDCSLPVRPCRTIEYAQSRSGKGDRLLVAAGRYEVRSAEEIFGLTSGMLDARGGFDRFDHFQTQAPDRNLTTLVGVPRQFRSQLRDRGFHVVVDRKGLRPRERLQLGAFRAGYAAMNTSRGRVSCDGGMAGAFSCSGVDLLAHVALEDFALEPPFGNDIWGFVDLNTEREYAVVGLSNGVSIVDVTDPSAPFEVGHVSGGDTYWRDVKVFQTYDGEAGRWRSYGYAGAEAADSVVVIDLTGLPNAVSLAGTHTDNTSSHNVYVSNVEYATNTPVAGWPAPLLQVLGSNERFGAFRSYSLGDPAAPELAGQSPAESAEHYSHDATSMLVTDGRAAACGSGAGACEVLFDFSESTFDLWDLSDQANPVLLSSTSYDGASYVHSGWWSEDQRYLFVHDELDEQYQGLNTTLRVFDLTSLRSPVQTTVWTGSTEAIDHNGYVRGNRYYMSTYTRGLTVLDITSPDAPRRSATSTPTRSRTRAPSTAPGASSRSCRAAACWSATSAADCTCSGTGPVARPRAKSRSRPRRSAGRKARTRSFPSSGTGGRAAGYRWTTRWWDCRRAPETTRRRRGPSHGRRGTPATAPSPCRSRTTAPRSP